MSGPDEELDVVIVGAGISGVTMARQLGLDHPGLSCAVLEARDRVGGTWDLFRYPGIRSDSGMDTFAFSFKPWTGTRHFGRGEEIRAYVEEAAADHGIDRLIRFRHRVTAADWDGGDARWTVTIESESGTRRIRCRFLIGCTGYYRYDRGFSPAFPGEEEFRGELFHAQGWPEGLELEGRDVVVVGSGATAITIVPALAEAGARVTMLQRSPSYVVSVPNDDPVGRAVKRLLPRRPAAALLRWLGVVTEIAQFQLSRRFPGLARRVMIRAARRQLPPGFDRRHLVPAYDPWAQRVCFAPDGDYYEALGSGRARIVTDRIARLTPGGLRLESGAELKADAIVKATGLDLQLFGGAELSLDGTPVDPADRLVHRGAMLSGIPNFVFVVGYTNASWTLKSELVARFASRLIATARRRAAAAFAPIAPTGPMATVPLLNLDSGYIHRAESRLPRAGDASPWVLHMNYFSDRRELLRGNLEDGTIEFR